MTPAKEIITHMTVPAEVNAALRALARPLRIGDVAQLEARRVMDRWRPQPCRHCSEGFIAGAQCRLCDGKGTVWAKRR